jgi:hypothetical protein
VFENVCQLDRLRARAVCKAVGCRFHLASHPDDEDEDEDDDEEEEICDC